MKNSVLVLLFFASFSTAFFADQIDKIAALLQQGQAHELGKICASSVEFNVLGDEKDVSGAQAEALLSTFFAAHKPVSAKVIHRINTNPSLSLAVVQLKTASGNFRISYSLKNTNGNQELTELRIEPDKG
jgi:hypothetical protein